MATRKNSTTKGKTTKRTTSAKSKAKNVVKAKATPIEERPTPKTLIAAMEFEKEAKRVAKGDLVEAMALKREARRIKEGRKSATLTAKECESRLKATLEKIGVSLIRAKHYARARGIFTESADWEGSAS